MWERIRLFRPMALWRREEKKWPNTSLFGQYAMAPEFYTTHDGYGYFLFQSRLSFKPSRQAVT